MDRCRDDGSGGWTGVANGASFEARRVSLRLREDRCGICAVGAIGPVAVADPDFGIGRIEHIIPVPGTVHPGLKRRLGVAGASEQVLGDGCVAVPQCADTIPGQPPVRSGVREKPVTSHIRAMATSRCHEQALCG